MKRFAGLAVAASLAALAVAPSAQADTTSSSCATIFLPIPLCVMETGATVADANTAECARIWMIPLCKQS